LTGAYAPKVVVHMHQTARKQLWLFTALPIHIIEMMEYLKQGTSGIPLAIQETGIRQMYLCCR